MSSNEDLSAAPLQLQLYMYLNVNKTWRHRWRRFPEIAQGQLY